MTWVKLDDLMPLHLKVLAASAEGFALDVAGICFSNRTHTDGFIADEMLSALYPPLRHPKKWADHLVAVGRWERVDSRGGYLIHDIEEYQPASDAEQERRDKRAAAGRIGGRKSRPPGSKSEANTEASASDYEKQTPKPNGTPVPVPTEELSSPVTATGPPVDIQDEDGETRRRIRKAAGILGARDMRKAITDGVQVKSTNGYLASCTGRWLDDERLAELAATTQLDGLGLADMIDSERENASKPAPVSAPIEYQPEDIPEALDHTKNAEFARALKAGLRNPSKDQPPGGDAA